MTHVPNAEEKQQSKEREESVKLSKTLEISPELMGKAVEAGIPPELLEVYLTLPSRVEAIEKTLERVAPILERINAAIEAAERARAAGETGTITATPTATVMPQSGGGGGMLDLIKAIAPFLLGGENPFEKLMYSFLSGTLRNQLAMQRHSMLMNVAGLRALAKLGLTKPKELKTAEEAIKIALMEEE